MVAVGLNGADLLLHELAGRRRRPAGAAGHLETGPGTIEVGKLAELLVLEQDPFTAGVERLDEVKVLLTPAGGAVGYDAGTA